MYQTFSLPFPLGIGQDQTWGERMRRIGIYSSLCRRRYSRDCEELKSIATKVILSNNQDGVALFLQEKLTT